MNVREQLQHPAASGFHRTHLRDLRQMLWASIDNDDSRDLDQLSVAEPPGDGSVKILDAVADVDGIAKKGSPIDGLRSLPTGLRGS